LAICQFRAIECRRPLVRAVNMGISAVIDGNGRVVALPGPTWQKSKGLMAVVKAPIPLDDRKSLFAWTGDWLPWLCWAGIAGGLVVGRKERVA
jgi:apolipoprotein N-acyltransferase